MALNNAINCPKVQSVNATTAQQMIPNVCYVLTTVDTYNITLPVTSEMGDMIHIVMAAQVTNCILLQNALQYIGADSKVSTPGVAGSAALGLASGVKAYAYYSLICIEKDKGWVFAGFQSGLDPLSWTFV